MSGLEREVGNKRLRGREGSAHLEGYDNQVCLVVMGVLIMSA